MSSWTLVLAVSSFELYSPGEFPIAGTQWFQWKHIHVLLEVGSGADLHWTGVEDWNLHGTSVGWTCIQAAISLNAWGESWEAEVWHWRLWWIYFLFYLLIPVYFKWRIQREKSIRDPQMITISLCWLKKALVFTLKCSSLKLAWCCITNFLWTSRNSIILTLIPICGLGFIFLYYHQSNLLEIGPKFFGLWKTELIFLLFTSWQTVTSISNYVVLKFFCN